MLSEDTTQMPGGRYEIIPSRQQYDTLGLQGRAYVDIDFEPDEDEDQPPDLQPDEVMFICARCKRPRVVSAVLYARLRKPAHCYRCFQFIEKKKRIAQELAS